MKARRYALYTEEQVLRALEARWLDADKSRTPHALILARVREGGGK